MSKSASSQAGVIDLLDDLKVVRKKVMSAVTDTEREIRYDPENKAGISNLLTIMSALTGREIPALEQEFAGQGYGDFKKAVAEVLVETLEPFQERYHRWISDDEGLDTILAEGAERARAVAAETMATVRDRVGFLAAKG
jgi:tryptophanyl-tRNA synthetase